MERGESNIPKAVEKMDESESGKYICHGREAKPRSFLPSDRPVGAGRLQGASPTPVMWLDNKIIPGAFYVENVWVWPECASERNVALAHTHPFGEVITFFGTNFDDPTESLRRDRVLARRREIRDDQELPCLRTGRDEALSPS